MIDKKTAEKIVTEYLNHCYPVQGDKLVILDEYTIETAYGWVFFFNSQRYLETNDFHYMVAGNGPLLVKKNNGSLYELGTASDVEESLREFEKTEGKWSKKMGRDS